MDDVVFKPWIGSKYYLDNQFGLRVLVLGESHYHDGPVDPDFTTGVVKYLAQSVRNSFFTKIATLLLKKEKGTWLSDAERADVWEHVAFYNYIQSYVGESSRIRPTEDMWLSAQKPFLAVIKELKQEVVLVLGFSLWSRLSLLALEGPEFCVIKHPSTGFRYQEWTPKFVDALNKAKILKQGDKL